MTQRPSICVALLALSVLFVSGCKKATTVAGQLDVPTPDMLESVLAITVAPDSGPTKFAKREAEEQVELGLVHWGRDLEVAKRKSAASGKPVFVLFQEVPG